MTLLFYDDRYFWDEGDVLEHALDSEGLEPEDFPIVASTCRKVYGHVLSAECVAEHLCEDYWHDEDGLILGHIYASAEWVAESYLEDLYFMCDEDQPEISEFEGMEDLERAIAFFRSINTPIYQLFSHFKWFNPREHALGLPLLDMALRHWARLNREKFYLWTPTNAEIKIEWQDID